MSVTRKNKVFIAEYLKDFNATRSAIAAGYSEKTAYSIGQHLLTKVEIQQEINVYVNKRGMPADEVLTRITAFGRGNISFFFKEVDEWTFYPLPSYEVIDAKVVLDTSFDPPKERDSYLVRHVVIDLDKVMDPRYSHLIKRFTDSPKNGMGIELYSAQEALNMLGKYHSLFTDKVELSGKDGNAIEVRLIQDGQG